jgi:hypothetical protein
VGKVRRTPYNAGDDATKRRLTVAQAADVLGTTPEAIRGRIRRRTIAVEGEAGRENRRIIAALTQRIPAIESPLKSPQEPPESPTEATEQPGRVEPQAQVEGAQEGAERPEERRSLWRRMFGG